MRGRLIFPLVAELRRLDDAAMAATATATVDPDFDEPRRTAAGVPVRVELPPLRLPCQVEPDREHALAPSAAGDVPRFRIALVFHFRDLERADLIEPLTGVPRLAAGDRLAALYDRTDALVEMFPNPPGYFATAATPLSYGLGARPRPNLLLVTFVDRPQGLRSAT
jgi:hypothetical protein